MSRRTEVSIGQAEQQKDRAQQTMQQILDQAVSEVTQTFPKNPEVYDAHILRLWANKSELEEQFSSLVESGIPVEEIKSRLKLQHDMEFEF